MANIKAIKKQIKHLLGIQNLSILEAKQILKESQSFVKLNRGSSKKLDLYSVSSTTLSIRSIHDIPFSSTNLVVKYIVAGISYFSNIGSATLILFSNPSSKVIAKDFGGN